jgi:4Fe-4S ferredoxin
MREVVLDSKEDRSQVYLPEKCIGCGTCVQACSKGALVIGSVGAVARGLIDKDFLEKRKGECVFCSMCAHICPIGALEEKLIVYQMEVHCMRLHLRSREERQSSL